MSSSSQVFFNSFNNRDLAFFVWVVIFFIYSSFKVPDFYKHILAVLKALFQKSIILIILLFFLNTFVSIYILKEIQLWDYGQARNTLWWVFTIGFVNLFKAIESRDTQKFQKNIIKDNFKVLMILEFFLNIFTLSFISEFFILPIATFITVAVAMTERKKEDEEAHKLFSNLQLIVGVLLLLYSGWALINNLDTFQNIKLYQDFWNPIFLSLLSIPFFYIIFTFSSYEIAFSVMQIMIKDENTRKYAKRQVKRSFNFKVNKLVRFKKLLTTQPCQTNNEIDELIALTNRQSRKNKRPPIVDINDGWCPYKSLNYLKDYNIDISFYNPLYLDKWTASSDILKSGSNIFQSYISYRIEGNENFVTLLSLSLTVNSHEEDLESIELFINMADELLLKSTKIHSGSSFRDIIVALDSLKTEINDIFIIELKYKPYSKSEGFKYTFNIIHKNHKTYSASDFK